MKSQIKPTPTQLEIISRDPQLFTDLDELFIAQRETVISGDIERRHALQERADFLRDQWRAEHAEEIAKADDEILGRIVNNDPEAAEYITRQMRARFKATAQADEIKQRAEAEKVQIAADAETQRQRADQAEADRHERHEQTFKPFDESGLAAKAEGHVYTVEDFLEAFDMKSENQKTVTRALTNWAKRCTKRPNREPRQKWQLDREQARIFYEDYIGDVRHQKRHALRTKAK